MKVIPIAIIFTATIRIP